VTPADLSKAANFITAVLFRQAVLDGVLDPRRTIQIGIRGNSEYLWEFSYASGMTVIHAEEVGELGIRAVINKIREVVGNGPTYLSFDVDALDPAFAPGTGTPEVGGLSSAQVLAVFRDWISSVATLLKSLRNTIRQATRPKLRPRYCLNFCAFHPRHPGTGFVDPAVLS